MRSRRVPQRPGQGVEVSAAGVFLVVLLLMGIVGMAVYFALAVPFASFFGS